MNAKSESQEAIPCVPALEGLFSLNFTQAIIAEQLGVGQMQVSRWRHGKISMAAVDVFTVTALLDLAVRTAEEGQDHDELTEAQKQVLSTRAAVARAWLELQEAMNAELPQEERAHALARYELRVEHLNRMPAAQRAASKW